MSEQNMIWCANEVKRLIQYNDNSEYSHYIEGDLGVKCNSCGKIIPFEVNSFAKADLKDTPKRFGADPVEVSVYRSIQCPHCGKYDEYANGDPIQIIIINDMLKFKGYESFITKSRIEFCCTEILRINITDREVRKILNSSQLHDAPFMLYTDTIRGAYATILCKTDINGYIDTSALDSLHEWATQLPDLNNNIKEEISNESK